MNKVMLMGRLTKPPELKYTANSNIPVIKFTLAVQRRFKKEGQDREADFIQIVAWNKLAEFISNYFNKGQKVVIVGRIQTRTWDDNEGNRNYITEVIAEEAYFAEAKREQQESQQRPQASNNNDYYPLESEDDLPF